ncbi:MAG: MBL fold metallo-hydrolase [Prevotella sp.]|nr:MBL fold metallo-hydrolase [Prevotella sp.]
MKRLNLLLLTLCITFGCSAQQHETDEFKTASGKTVKMTCIKHASIMMEYDGKVFYFDPVINMQPYTDYTTWPKANFIFVTHEHKDHFDTMALTELRRNYTVIYVNHNVYTQWGSGYVMANGDKAEVCDNVTVEAVPAYNNTPGHEQFHPKGRDNGYILTIENLRIYVAGDTEDIPEMADIKDIDIAFLPCNQPYTMTPEQLVKVAKTIRPKVLFPYHYSDTPIRKVTMLLGGSGIDVRIRRYQ